MSGKFNLIFHTKISKIDERLYLGDIMDAQNKTLLQKLGVTHVLNMARESPCFHLANFQYKKISAIDQSSFDLSGHLHDAADFIADGMKGGGVFVHCAYGISRGSSAVIAYIMKYRKLSFEEAKAFVQTRRSHICPNSGFVKSLKILQRGLGIKGNDIRYARLQKAAQDANSSFNDLGLGAPARTNKRSATTTLSSRFPGVVPLRKVDPMFGLKRMREKLERQDQELTEFKNFAGNLGVGLQIARVKKNIQVDSYKQQPKVRGISIIDKRSEQDFKISSKKKKIAGYCCKECRRMLVEIGQVINHKGVTEIRCNNLFIEKQPWFKADIIGCKVALLCPNPRCRAKVGQQSQQGCFCDCGFEDNPASTLDLASIAAYKE